MEILKQRLVPVTLKYMRSLNARLKLTDKERLYYSNLEKGYAGELIFDQLLLTNLSLNCLVLNDILLESNNNEFQNDTFLFSQNTLYQFEVKNFEGDFYIEENKWYAVPKFDIKNPLIQLERNETLFRQFAKELGIQITIKPYLIFVNPHFHLYHAPRNQQIIFPTQLKRFLHKLNRTSSTLTDVHYRIAEEILSHHINVSKNMKIPEYSYDSLAKGMLCGPCHSLTTEYKEDKLVCKRCGHFEDIESAITRAVNELIFLFPDIKITVKLVSDWCNVIKSKKKIRRILMKNYKLLRHGQSSYYI
ncbi:nuclease-related domain-containing protein [Bacillus sp. T3]|uniref:nuclease-related domain-containing protein n=1 Tax=Bacillus sp. T3 TaxID=467262 RepID=UPI002981648A|nr:nuclease-related domain-containing protein [Bacillus sp. T3]